MSVYPLTDPENLSMAIKLARDIWGYSQRELADKAGVSQKFVSELESGKQTVQLSQTLKVCSALELAMVLDASRLLAKAQNG